MTNLHALYFAALEADKDLSALIVATYGPRNAGDNRYRYHTDPALLEAWARKAAADLALHEATKTAREARP